ECARRDQKPHLPVQVRFDKYVFSVPFGNYDDSDERHRELVFLVERAEEIAATVDISVAKTFQSARKLVHKALDSEGISSKIEAVVEGILPEISLEEDETGEKPEDSLGAQEPMF